MNSQSNLSLYSPAQREEFSAIVSLVESLKPWRGRAVADVLDMIDHGIIRQYPVNTMVTDIRRVIASHRAMHDLEGGAV
jgi:hypothetical protein